MKTISDLELSAVCGGDIGLDRAWDYAHKAAPYGAGVGVAAGAAGGIALGGNPFLVGALVAGGAGVGRAIAGTGGFLTGVGVEAWKQRKH